MTYSSMVSARVMRGMFVLLGCCAMLGGVGEAKGAKRVKVAKMVSLPPVPEVEIICPVGNKGKKASMQEKRMAMLHGRLEAIARGGDINAVDKTGQTALMYATAAGNDLATCWLVAKGADVTIKNKSGKMAVDYTTSEDIRELLDVCAHLKMQTNVTQEQREKYTKELRSSMESNFDFRRATLAEFADVLAHGADVSVMAEVLREEYNYGEFAPMTRLALLVRCGYDVNTRVDGVAGLSFYFYQDDIKLLQALGFKKDGLNAADELLFAFLSDDLPAIQEMLEKHKTEVTGRYRWRYPDACCSVEAGRALIKAGGEPPRDLYTWAGYRPQIIPLVVECNKERIMGGPSPLSGPEGGFGTTARAAKLVEALFNAGFNSKEDIKAGLECGVLYKNVHVLKALVAVGAEIKGSSLLCKLFEHGRRDYQGIFDKRQETRIPAVAKYLIEQGADVNAVDENGNTPLHGAILALKPDSYKDANTPGVVEGIVEGIRLLVKAGAKVPEDIKSEIDSILQQHPAAD